MTRRVVKGSRRFLLILMIAFWSAENGFVQVQDVGRQSDLEEALSDFSQGRYESAIIKLERMARNYPPDPAVYHVLGLSHLKKGDATTGLAHLRRSLEMEPGNAAFAINLAKALLGQGQRPMAASILQATLQTREDQRVFCMLGLLALDEGDGEKAIGLFRKASELDPRDPAAWYYMGLTHHAYNHFEDAIQCYRRSIKLNPKDFQTYLQLGKVYVTLQLWNEALAQLEAAEKFSTVSPEVYRYLCETYLRLNRVDQALAAGGRAVTLAPHDGSAHLQLAKALVRAGRHEEAREHMRLKDSQSTETEPSLSEQWERIFKPRKQ